jgi:hypothetical protein
MRVYLHRITLRVPGEGMGRFLGHYLPYKCNFFVGALLGYFATFRLRGYESTDQYRVRPQLCAISLPWQLWNSPAKFNFHRASRFLSRCQLKVPPRPVAKYTFFDYSVSRKGISYERLPLPHRFTVYSRHSGGDRNRQCRFSIEKWGF